MTRTSCYLVLKAERRRGTDAIRSVKVVAVRIGRPNLLANEAAVKVILDVPDGVFDPAEVAVVVDPRAVTLAAEIEAPELADV